MQCFRCDPTVLLSSEVKTLHENLRFTALVHELPLSGSSRTTLADYARTSFTTGITRLAPATICPKLLLAHRCPKFVRNKLAALKLGPVTRWPRCDG